MDATETTIAFFLNILGKLIVTPIAAIGLFCECLRLSKNKCKKTKSKSPF